MPSLADRLCSSTDPVIACRILTRLHDGKQWRDIEEARIYRDGSFRLEWTDGGGTEPSPTGGARAPRACTCKRTRALKREYRNLTWTAT